MLVARGSVTPCHPTCRHRSVGTTPLLASQNTVTARRLPAYPSPAHGWPRARHSSTSTTTPLLSVRSARFKSSLLSRRWACVLLAEIAKVVTCAARRFGFYGNRKISGERKGVEFILILLIVKTYLCIPSRIVLAIYNRKYGKEPSIAGCGKNRAMLKMSHTYLLSNSTNCIRCMHSRLTCGK